jgi:hypothetical protein
MSLNQSWLDNYGYDVVVAMTQDSLNEAILGYLANKQPVVTKCWTLDDYGKSGEISHKELVRRTGIDPFALGPDEEKNKDAIKKLGDGWTIPGTEKSRWFQMGFRAQMGKPPGVKDADLPDIVSLGTDATKVQYRLLCKEFTVVELAVQHHGYGWTSISQPPGNPWVFDCNVNLTLKTTPADNLSHDAQKRVHDLPVDTFSIQQLLFEFGVDSTFVTPEIKDAQGKLDTGSDLLVMLQKMFVNSYFDEMKKAGSPILRLNTYENAQKAKEAPSPLTSMGFSIDPYQGDKDSGLTTLNYLALMDSSKTLPTVKPFGWNWVEKPQDKNEPANSGVFALSRSHFVNWLIGALQPYVQRNCWRASTLQCYDQYMHITYGAAIYNPDLNDLGNVTWSPRGSAPANEEYKDPVRFPSHGPTLASWHWKSERIANAGYASNSALTLNCYFDLSVSCDADSLIIDESLVVYMYCEHYTMNWGSGNIVDRRRIRRYPLNVAGHGTLVLGTGVDQPGGHDNSFDPSIAWASYSNDMHDEYAKIWANVHPKTDISFNNLPISVLQQNVFPNGKSFLFEKPSFSAHQDLVAYISYPDQS